MKPFALLLASALLVAPLAAAAAKLEIAVNGVKSDQGFIRAAVCSQAKFLTEDCEYFIDAPAVEGKTILASPDIAPGKYAVQVFHDTTGGGVIHRGLFGIPKEGIGFSNNARLHLHGPKFSEAMVNVPEGTTRIRLRLRYLGGFHPTESSLAGR